MDDVEQTLNRKEKLISNYLREVHESNNIDIEFSNKVQMWSSGLANNIRALFYAYNKLAKELGWEGDLDQILDQIRKSHDVVENGNEMEKIITRKPFNPDIQLIATTEARMARVNAKFPELLGGGLPDIEPIYAYQEGTLLWGSQTVPIDDSLVIIGSLYHYVTKKIPLPDPPDDWFKNAAQIIYVGGGDCDCLTILFSTLAWYLGFTVILNFQDKHVFPSVPLKKLVRVDKQELDSKVLQQIRQDLAKKIKKELEKIDNGGERVEADKDLDKDSKEKQLDELKRVKEEMLKKLSYYDESRWLFRVENYEVCFDFDTTKRIEPAEVYSDIDWYVAKEMPLPKPSGVVDRLDLPFPTIYSAGFQRYMEDCSEKERQRLKDVRGVVENQINVIWSNPILHRHVIRRRPTLEEG